MTDRLSELRARCEQAKYSSGLDGWWSGRVLALIDERAALLQQLDELTKERDAAREEIAVERADTTEYMRRAGVLNADLSALRSTIANQDAANVLLHEELDDLRSTIAQQQRVIEAMRPRHKSCRDGLHVGSGAFRDMNECVALANFDRLAALDQAPVGGSE